MHSKDRGDIAEYKVIAKFLEKEWAVSKTVGDNQSYDLILDRGLGKLERVQVKNGKHNGRSIKIELKSCGYRFIDGKPIYFAETYDPKDLELFASYCKETDKVYLIPNDILRSEIRLWTESPKNNQKKLIHYAATFEI